MAAKKNGHGEMVLESRHLFGLFVLLAVMFGVVFTLGYLLGRGQGDSQAHVAAIRADDSADAPGVDPSDVTSTPPLPTDNSSPATGATGAPKSSGADWSFYHSSDSKPANDTLEPAPSAKTAKPAKPAASTSEPAATPASSSAAAPSAAKPAPKPAAAPATSAKSSKPTVAVGSPLIPKNAIVLQVAAVEKESDALAMAQALQQRKFPAFVLPAGVDKYYRVQVGPYANPQAAAAGQKQLESQGFKSIVKR
jgi:cell division septation protein DedD